MDIFEDFLLSIADLEHRNKLKTLFTWITDNYPTLKKEIKWSQPMFIDHGTFIIGFSVAKQHIAVAPENLAIDHFVNEINACGYDHTNGMIRIRWTDQLDFDLLKSLIDFNIDDKKDCQTFWR